MEYMKDKKPHFQEFILEITRESGFLVAFRVVTGHKQKSPCKILVIRFAILEGTVIPYKVILLHFLHHDITGHD